jgi:hypothetical protein
MMASPEAFYEAAQAPSAWLATAEKLAEAAETIATSQATLEEGFQRACEAAFAEAEASESCEAEITHVEPNYLPAGLLYGFAMENALKGLIIAKQPAVVSRSILDTRINTHDLVRLAKDAGFTLNNDERHVLERISIVVKWAGRYPVARDVHTQKRIGRSFVPTNRFLNWISWQDVIREFFERVRTELEQTAGGSRKRFGVMVLLKD